MNKFNKTEQKIIDEAKTILQEKFKQGTQITSAMFCQNYLIINLSEEEAEWFYCLFLNSGHKIISFEKLFSGTINRAAVYPREVAKKALQHNAAAVIIAHNHTSGSCEPSDDDIKVTGVLKKCLELFDIKLLDHIIVSAGNSISLSEEGKI